MPVTRSDVVKALNAIKARMGLAGGRETQSSGGAVIMT